MTLKKNFMDENKRPASAIANKKNKGLLDINSEIDRISFLERTDMALDNRTIIP